MSTTPDEKWSDKNVGVSTSVVEALPQEELPAVGGLQRQLKGRHVVFIVSLTLAKQPEHKLMFAECTESGIYRWSELLYRAAGVLSPQCFQIGPGTFYALGYGIVLSGESFDA